MSDREIASKSTILASRTLLTAGLLGIAVNSGAVSGNAEILGFSSDVKLTTQLLAAVSFLVVVVNALYDFASWWGSYSDRRLLEIKEELAATIKRIEELDGMAIDEYRDHIERLYPFSGGLKVKVFELVSMNRHYMALLYLFFLVAFPVAVAGGIGENSAIDQGFKIILDHISPVNSKDGSNVPT